MTVAEPSHTANRRRAHRDGIERFREKVGVDWPYTGGRRGTRGPPGTASATTPTASVTTTRCGATLSTRPSRWGGVVAPPGFLEGAGVTPKLAIPPNTRVAGGERCGRPHVLGGRPLRFFNPVREGDRIWVRRFYVGIEEKERSRFGGRSALSVRRRVDWNDRGELIAIWDADFVHTERDTAAKRDTLKEACEQHVYTEEELAVVDEHYEPRRSGVRTCVTWKTCGSETISATRYRGPLIVGDVIVWLMGNGRHEIFPYRLNWKNRRRMGGFYRRTSSARGTPRCACTGTTHTRSRSARRGRTTTGCCATPGSCRS